jgi:antitoxin ParD1/3/4
METMNIALPEPMKAFVQVQVKEGGYSSASEYMRDLIRADQKRKAEARLEALLLEGLEGHGVEATEEWWEAFRAKLRERHRKKAKGR